jgi:hypothetical protein
MEGESGATTYSAKHCANLDCLKVEYEAYDIRNGLWRRNKIISPEDFRKSKSESS